MQTHLLGKGRLGEQQRKWPGIRHTTTSNPPRRPVDNEDGQGSPQGPSKPTSPVLVGRYGLSLECVDVARPPPPPPPPPPHVPLPLCEFHVRSSCNPESRQNVAMAVRQAQYPLPGRIEKRRRTGRCGGRKYRCPVVGDAAALLLSLRDRVPWGRSPCCPTFSSSPRQPRGFRARVLTGALSVALHLIDSSSSFNFTLELTNLGTYLSVCYNAISHLSVRVS
ncbi:hypothetical protein CGRA01v4_08571 [Colletotrichum graminicola]|nr:hypothetical protein CGRA01v4_08571 [Colletotrichum graminicola]